jgi:outer membrane protein
VKIDGGYMLMGPVQRLRMAVDPGIPGIDPIVLDNALGSLHNASVGVTVAWRAFDFGARGVRTAAAKALVAASKAETAQRVAEIAYATRAAYLAALFFDEMATVTSGSLKVARAEQREHKIRKKAGVGNDLDVARSDIRVAELKSRHARAQQERGRALVTLRILLGLKPGTSVRLTDSLQKLGSTPVTSRAKPRQHPSRLRFRALERASRLEYKRLGRSRWPTLDLVGQVKLQYPKNFFENDQAGVFYSVGVQLTWSVFDGDLIRRQRHQAQHKVNQVKALARATNEEISRKLSDAGAKVRIAATSVGSAKTMIRAANVYLRAARVSRKNGLTTALEVRKAEEKVDQARLGEIKAYFDGALARAAHLRAQGKGTR